MKHIPLACITIGLCALYAYPANAQMQQGYTGDRPQVQVDRSVLEDLKGYEPPPMFASPPTEPISETPARISPPETPILTTPKAEDILDHPVENTQVITEQRPQLTVPEGDSIAAPLLPLPDDDDESQPLPSHKPKQLAQKNNSKETLTIIEPVSASASVPIPAPKKIVEAVKPKPAKSVPATGTDTNKNTYRPSATKTMPAVPSVAVEKAALPALPPTTDNMKENSKPTIGERIMDAALERHIESNPDKIKDTLKIAPEKAASAKTKNSASEQSNSLVFPPNDTNLTDALKSKIRKSILPDITKEALSRIQILSFAVSADGSESSARRIALARALAVRDYLLEQKTNPSRIDVRALASQKGETMPDRVDIVLLKP